DVVDAEIDLSAISLELRLAGASRTNAAAELRHSAASSGKAGKLVFELRKLHLQLPLARAGMASEDVEDQLRAVDNAARQLRRQVAKLRRREIVIEEDEIGVGTGGDSCDL